MGRPKKYTVLNPYREKWLPATMAAAELGISVRQLNNWRRERKIEARPMPNGRWGFPMREIHRMLSPSELRLS